MKSFFLLIPIFLFLVFESNAQIGIYKYKSKSSKEDIELNLRKDGVFLYTYSKEWTNCTTKGTWRPLGYGKAMLNSEYQLTDYVVQEIEEEGQTDLHLIIQSKGKGQSPTTINSLFINENENTVFKVDGEAGLKMLEERQKLILSGSQSTRDSLNNSDTPRFYVHKGLKKVKTITILFDLKEITFEIKNPKANKFIITTAFAPNAAYHYMKDVQFIGDDKFIRQEGSSIKLKRQKG